MLYKRTKYIIVEDPEFGPLPYIFPNIITHFDFARTIGEVVISAGFCDITTKGTWNAYGHSESLHLKSRPEDSEILTRFLIGR